MEFDSLLTLLLGLAWLLPLGSFAIILVVGPRMGRGGRGAGYLATAAIVSGFGLSVAATAVWLLHHPLGHETAAAVSGDWYTLGEFGSLRITIGYFIDGLTLVMFSMVTLVASCIHVYSFGYMHEELHPVTDPVVALTDGQTLTRRGRFHRFYQYLSLFSFSMLGLLIAGNVAMVFVFWELVGICSYLLIGFYFERGSASTAANKAFIVNRVGDFGFLVGLMVLWGGLGTFQFGEIFEQVRPAEQNHALTVPDGLVRMAAGSEFDAIQRTSDDPASAIAARRPDWEHKGYWLLGLAGLGIFCGCVGKSAQFPLHVWLPDAMEGPTPVSALIHAATMVAAGVYLVGRFYPVFTPEVLLVIAYVGTITLFLGATIAITATDIKRVLAYSTVSQLGYMMLALGVGGWLAGLFHLITHAFFKSLLFLSSGSVIHATGTNEMPEMGGLRRKMPWTAATMLVGCLAISGAGLPLVAIGMHADVGFSGFHSKEEILKAAFQHKEHIWLYYIALFGAAVTAFYMFRLWYMTFAGEPRDQHRFEHAHESPWVMVAPLVVLAALAVVAAWHVPFTGLSVAGFLEQATPTGAPSTHVEGTHHAMLSLVALSAALTGFVVATIFYGLRLADPAKIANNPVVRPIYLLLLNKWWFDEFYRLAFLWPTLWLARLVAGTDRNLIDRLVDGLAATTRGVARLDDWLDRLLVDGLVNGLAAWTYRTGISLRAFQTGRLRQYVLTVAVGTVALVVLLGLYWKIVNNT